MSAYDEDPDRAKRFTWNDGDVEIIKGGGAKIIPSGGLKLPPPDVKEHEDAEEDELRVITALGLAF